MLKHLLSTAIFLVPFLFVAGGCGKPGTVNNSLLTEFKQEQIRLLGKTSRTSPRAHSKISTSLPRYLTCKTPKAAIQAMERVNLDISFLDQDGARTFQILGSCGTPKEGDKPEEFGIGSTLGITNFVSVNLGLPAGCGAGSTRFNLIIDTSKEQAAAEAEYYADPSYDCTFSNTPPVASFGIKPQTRLAQAARLGFKREFDAALAEGAKIDGNDPYLEKVSFEAAQGYLRGDQIEILKSIGSLAPSLLMAQSTSQHGCLQFPIGRVQSKEKLAVFLDTPSVNLSQQTDDGETLLECLFQSVDPEIVDAVILKRPSDIDWKLRTRTMPLLFYALAKGRGTTATRIALLKSLPDEVLAMQADNVSGHEDGLLGFLRRARYENSDEVAYLKTRGFTSTGAEINDAIKKGDLTTFKKLLSNPKIPFPASQAYYHLDWRSNSGLPFIEAYADSKRHIPLQLLTALEAAFARQVPSMEAGDLAKAVRTFEKLIDSEPFWEPITAGNARWFRSTTSPFESALIALLNTSKPALHTEALELTKHIFKRHPNYQPMYAGWMDNIGGFYFDLEREHILTEEMIRLSKNVNPAMETSGRRYTNYYIKPIIESFLKMAPEGEYPLLTKVDWDKSATITDEVLKLLPRSACDFDGRLSSVEALKTLLSLDFLDLYHPGSFTQATAIGCSLRYRPGNGEFEAASKKIDAIVAHKDFDATRCFARYAKGTDTLSITEAMEQYLKNTHKLALEEAPSEPYLGTMGCYRFKKLP